MSEHGSSAVLSQHSSIAAPRIIYRSDEAYLPARQCDCACAAPAGLIPTVMASLDSSIPYTPNPILFAQSLPLSYQTVLSPCGVVVLNPAAASLMTAFDGGWTSHEVLQYLATDWPAGPTYTVLQEMVGLGLLLPLDAQSQIPPETPTTLNVWLHITNTCNLRCAYCYVPKTDESMSPEIGQQAIDATFRSATRHGFSRVKLKYAGGEPSLRFDLVMQLHAYARTRAEVSGLELEAALLSNGVALSNQMLKALLIQDIRLSISLDGLDEDHDAQRPLANGSGSASMVRRTIERALALGLTPDITVTVTGRNMDALPDTVAWLLEHELPFNLNFYRGNDNSASHTDLRLQDERLIACIHQAFSAIEKQLPQRNLFGSLLDRAHFVAPHHYPCAAAHNYLVIDHYGRIAQCQIEMAHPITDIWADDPLAEVQHAQDGIPGLSVDEKESCQSCQWRYWCAGGCPLRTYRATGRYDTRSPLCAVYRALFPDLIRLEGLRLLKYAMD